MVRRVWGGHQLQALHQFHVVEILEIGIQRVEPGLMGTCGGEDADGRHHQTGLGFKQGQKTVSQRPIGEQLNPSRRIHHGSLQGHRRSGLRWNVFSPCRNPLKAAEGWLGANSMRPANDNT